VGSVRARHFCESWHGFPPVDGHRKPGRSSPTGDPGIVKQPLEVALGRFLARWVGLVGRRPVLVILLTLPGANEAGACSVGHLGVEGVTDRLFAHDLHLPGGGSEPPGPPVARVRFR
jgi:hypothetical protein